jgi:hypothetical protein
MSLINGLPAHVLLVHIVVVLVPLTALALVAAAVWPRAARRLGPLLPVLALVALISVPLATSAGDWLEKHVDADPLVSKHADLGDTMLPWALGLFLLAAIVWWAGRNTPAETEEAAAADESGEGAKSRGIGWSALPVRIVVGVLSLAVAVGAVVDVYRIGDSGAKAAWHDAYSQTATKSKD